MALYGITFHVHIFGERFAAILILGRSETPCFCCNFPHVEDFEGSCCMIGEASIYM